MKFIFFRFIRYLAITTRTKEWRTVEIPLRGSSSLRLCEPPSRRRTVGENEEENDA
jgi:hypothetical protein